MPRTLSSAEYTELGKRYYARKEYQKALDAFTEARHTHKIWIIFGTDLVQGIEASTANDICLFDYRAATWEKLDNLPSALADGRRMIKVEKTDARVCICCAFLFHFRILITSI
jgi:F-box/TPR repeat protein Pof3